MSKGQTSLERRLKGRADALIILMMDGYMTATEVADHSDRMGVNKDTILRASDYLAKKREIDHRPFPDDMYEGINRTCHASPTKNEIWCPKKGHYVDVYNSDGELNFYEAHLKNVMENNYTGCAKSATCKKCHIVYMAKLEQEQRTTRAKLAAKVRKRGENEQKNRKTHEDKEYVVRKRNRNVARTYKAEQRSKEDAVA